MIVSNDQSPVRRMQVPRAYLRRVIVAGVVVVLATAGIAWDYVRLRADNSELGLLRIQTSEQHEQIQVVEQTLASVRDELGRVRELERKVRIIANLPGAAGVGGEDISALAPAQTGETEEEKLLPPAGAPVGSSYAEGVDEQGRPLSQVAPAPLELGPVVKRDGLTTDGARHIRSLDSFAAGLGDGMGQQAEVMTELLDQLEEKRKRLVSMPSVWPTRGWLTSRYGYRVSPFTMRRQLHGGIDIANEHGSAIVAPAQGKVEFVGSRGPLGKTLIIDHGFGVRTLYGHTSKIFVKKGDQVVRGQSMAAVGNTGRSTGPHLHYVVQVDGKSRDPLDYIFD
jgi:murein DD-endopeptidase MepM/ murein hydrolase activator NlpD